MISEGSDEQKEEVDPLPGAGAESPVIPDTGSTTKKHG